MGKYSEINAKNCEIGLNDYQDLNNNNNVDSNNPNSHTDDKNTLQGP